MYINVENSIVKPNSIGLGQVEVEPGKTEPLAGSTFVFKYTVPQDVATKNLNEAFAELMNVGKAMFGDRNLFGPQIFGVTGVGFSNAEIRIWIKFYNDLGTLFGIVKGTLNQFVGRFDQILEKHLGSGAAKFEGVYRMSGKSKTVSGSPLWDIIGPFVPYVAAIGAAYFLIPPIIRELRKKQ